MCHCLSDGRMLILSNESGKNVARNNVELQHEIVFICEFCVFFELASVPLRPR